MSTELTVIARAAKALGSADHEPALVELAKQAADITTIKNADGRAQVHGAYMTLKTRRTDIRKAGKDARDDATKFSKAVIAEEDRLVAIIEPEETRLLKLRDYWDAAREAERREKAQAAQRRKDEIRCKIDELRAIPVNLVDAAPDRIANAIDDVEAFEVTASEFDDQVDAAHLARASALAKLHEMHTLAVVRAAEAAQLAAERAELAKQRAEQEERERQAAAERAEQECKDREAREAEEAQRREAQRQADEAMRAEREAHEKRMAEDRAAVAREAAELAAERQRIADEAEAHQQAEEAAAAANVQAEADAIFDAEQARLKEIDDIWSRPEPAVITVSPAAMERLIDALDEPAAPNAALTRAMSSAKSQPVSREAKDAAIRNAAPALLEALIALVADHWECTSIIASDCDSSNWNAERHAGEYYSGLHDAYDHILGDVTEFINSTAMQQARAAIALARQTEAQEVAA